jgi:hypothetical protein
MFRDETKRSEHEKAVVSIFIVFRRKIVLLNVVVVLNGIFHSVCCCQVEVEKHIFWELIWPTKIER